MLFGNFDGFEDRTALIRSDGVSVTYKQLQEKVNSIIPQLGSDVRKLVFIECCNNELSIYCYVACIQAGHPVLLLNSESKAQNQNIISTYNPNLVIDATGEHPDISLHNTNELDLHQDISLLLATSGSTGSPKLVKLSKDNIYTNTDSISQYLNLEETDRAITSLKLNYSYGLSIVNSHLHVGASIVLTELSTSEPEFWSLVQLHQVTSFSGVPYSYEILSKQQINFADYPSLRYVTQAGGKLSPSLISQFSRQLQPFGVEFFVMYGQTEAAPRISYLPPEFAQSHSDCIGIPIPGGEIALLSEDGEWIETSGEVGELLYRGPNVMIGYATDTSGLANKENIQWLHTGDLAYKNSVGLFKIVGRKSRFAKPFGVRVNLDDVQHRLTEEQLTVAVAENKETIVIAIERNDCNKEDTAELLNILEKEYKINKLAISIHWVKALPLLPNGKLDYSQVALLAQSEAKQTWKQFWVNFKSEILHLTGIQPHSWENLIQLYQHYFPENEVDEHSSFNSLSGDSLLYVAVSIELEKYMSYLPNNWQSTKLLTLEGMRERDEF